MTAGVKQAGKKETAPEAPFVLKEYDKIAEIASFFGFLPIKTPVLTKEDISKASVFKNDKKKEVHETESIFPPPEEKIALMRTYTQHNMTALSHPLMLYYRKPFGGLGERKKPNAYQCGLDIIGTSNSVAEALVIKTLFAILSEQGFDSLTVDINTIGDRDSMARYERELSNYFRKNIQEIPVDYKQIFKKDLYEIPRCDTEGCYEIRDRAPKSMGCLSEQSIQHFKEVLEYLETLNIPYRINENLIGDRTYCSQTIFEIRGNYGGRKEMENMLLAAGCRHNYFTKKIGFKKDIPIMSGTINLKKVSEALTKPVSRKLPRPKFYFVQLGFRARLKSLIIIDTLRKARIPVSHSLTKEKLMNQLTTAESARFTHLIIMGQKEAIDDTVVIRNMNTRAQDTVSLNELSQYLLKLK